MDEMKSTTNNDSRIYFDVSSKRIHRPYSIKEEEEEDLKQSPIPQSTKSVLPSLRGHEIDLSPPSGSNISLETLVRLCRSRTPRDILLKLAVNRHLLLTELSAIRIQTLMRQFLARRRYAKLRKNLERFTKITEKIVEWYIEENLIYFAFDISVTALKTHVQFNVMYHKIEEIILSQFNSVIDEVIYSIGKEIVLEILSQSATNYMILHKYGSFQRYQSYYEYEQVLKRNPIMAILLSTYEEVSDSFIKNIVVESILEETSEYMLELYSQNVVDSLHSDIINTFLTEVAEETLQLLTFTKP